MGNQETAEAFLAAINTLDLDAAAPYVADDFQYSGPFPDPVSLQEWQATATLWKAAFPDWRFNAQVERVEGEVVYVGGHVTGTHMGDWNLTARGMGIIPATGRSFSLPPMTGHITLEGGKITSFHWNDPPGVPAFLAQLGVELPST